MGLAGKLSRFLSVQRDGPLTEELKRGLASGGLGQLPLHVLPDATTSMVCGYCSTGCQLNIHLREGEAIGLTPTVDAPVNLGMACPKGWEALTPLKAADRAVVPLLRNARGEPTPCDWDLAMRTMVGRFRSLQERHGPESVAFLGTGQMTTEEMALLGSLTKFGMGMRHGDGNTRQCMATSVVAYKQAFGFDAPPFTYDDLEQSDVLVFIGANPCLAHPILWQRVMRNARTPRIVVIDPRRTETAMQASLHLPVRPKSDLVLLYGIARILIENDWLDRQYIAQHTVGFEELETAMRGYSLERVERETGIAAEQIEQLARLIGTGDRVSFWWTMGVNQSHQGVRTAQAIINLALLTGNLGRPGTGANSITGQCNAMGSRLFSNTTNLLGGRDFKNVEHRREVASTLGIPERRIPDTESWPYHQIFEGILRGKIKGLWVICTNPAHSWINQNLARDILDRLEFLVVQDMYSTTETARQAHLILPAAGWGEKEGTFINSERRISLVKRVARAPGQALSDFAIFRLVAEYWGCGELFREWSSPEAVFQILKRLSVGRPCDFSGIEDYDHLDRVRGIQWPYRDGVGEESAERRLFEDGRFYHGDGKARFMFDEPRPMPERPNERFPLLLLTGRGSAAQWHTETRTGKSAVLRKLHPRDPYVEIHPEDARELGIATGDWVLVASQRGELEAKAMVTASVPRGGLFIPMHDSATNRLTDGVFDPHSHQPAYKACAVRVAAIRT